MYNVFSAVGADSGDDLARCRILLCSAGPLRKRTTGTPPDYGRLMPCTLGQLSHDPLGMLVSQNILEPLSCPDDGLCMTSGHLDSA